MAQAIEENFYDPALGRQIGEGLRDAASEGKFDGLTSGYAVAEALSAELGPLDGHLRVRWTEPSAAQADAAQSVDASGGDLGAMDDTVSGTPGGGGEL